MKICTILLLLITLFSTAVFAVYAEQNIPPNHPKIELPAQTTTHEHTKEISGKVLESMNSGGETRRPVSGWGRGGTACATRGSRRERSARTSRQRPAPWP